VVSGPGRRGKKRKKRKSRVTGGGNELRLCFFRFLVRGGTKKEKEKGVTGCHDGVWKEKGGKE